MSDKFYIGLDITGWENNGIQPAISRVTLLADDENAYTAGDDTGYELTADCPHATQAMVNTILAQIKGYKYKMYSADAANIDPAAELGDGVTVNGIYSVMSRASEDGSSFANISAPGEAELEDEYPAAGPMAQAFNRKIAETRSSITKTAGEIRLEVASNINSLSSEFSVKLDSITGRVNGLESDYSSLEQYVDSITLSVSNGSTSSTIKLMAGGVTINTETITMSGLVTYTGLANGTTTINGGCIKTGTIDAEYLNLTGAISFHDLTQDVQDDINDAYTMASDAQDVVYDLDDTIGEWSYHYRGQTYIDGGMIMTGTVRASTLEGGEVNLLDEDGYTAGSFYLTGASSYSGRKVVMESGAIEINATYGDLYMSNGDGTSFYLRDGEALVGGDLAGGRDNMYSCGTSSFRWSDIYCANDTIITSDLNKKHDVRYGTNDYNAFFDMLRPMSFLFNDGTSGRRHIGLGAQDVEQAIAAAGLDTMDFAGFVKSPRAEKPGAYDYALRYGEFIPLCIDQIQRLKARVAELEGSTK